MAIFEFSDGFDAQGWYMEHPEALGDEQDPYGWDEPAEYPF